MHSTTNNRNGVTLLIVLAMMIMFAMLITAFMVTVSQNRRAAEANAYRLIGRSNLGPLSGQRIVVGTDDANLEQAFRLLLSGDAELRTIVSPYSILENLYGNPQGEPFTGTFEDNPFALRPNILAPNIDGIQEYKEFLQEYDVRLNPPYTFPDHTSMFLAWNDVRSDGWAVGITPSFHRPHLVPDWDGTTLDEYQKNELRKYVLRPLPTDHPNFTGSNTPNPQENNLTRWLREGPWDVDNDGDGVPDGIWLDVGLEPQFDDTSQTWYKPLISYYIIDLDGRVNVNTLGNLAQYGVQNDGSPRGMGLGAAELLSDLILEAVLLERYGDDQQPGNEVNNLLEDNGINLDAYTRGGVRTDWFGTTPIAFDELGNRIPPTLTESDMPIPYLMSPYPNINSGDNPFDTADLESLIRSVLDADYDTLPRRLRRALGNPYPQQLGIAMPALRYGLTTRSSDIPLASPLEAVAQSVWHLLPEEIQRGEKVNLNRLTLSPNWAVHWNPDATPAERNALLREKVRFAQEIFYLLRVVLREEIDTPEALERLAQWSVNLVDFMDPDDVMTPFIFHTDYLSIVPFDNASLISDLLAGNLVLPNNCELIWGLEKPEVVITETLAVHDRRVSMGYSGGPVRRQEGMPEGSLFVELYRQGNPHRDYSASRLVDDERRLDLGRQVGTAPQFDYVWRLAIGEAAKTAAGQFTWNVDNVPSRNALRQLLTSENGVRSPQFYQWHYANPTAEGAAEYRPELGLPERFVWFGQLVPQPPAPIPPVFNPNIQEETNRRSFIDHDNRAADYFLIPPGGTFIIAPRDITYLGQFGEASASSIDLSPFEYKMFAQIGPYPAGDNRHTAFSASEPLPGVGLASGYSLIQGSQTYTSPNPLDDGANGTIPFQLGTIPAFKTICLQRLADPNRPHHPVGNPYITVDWTMIDLQVINTGDGAENEIGLFPDTPNDPDSRFASRDWIARQGNPETRLGLANIWDRTLTDTERSDAKAGLPTSGTAENPVHTLGNVDFDRDILHFPWNDAPLMNTGELMLVPTSAPGRFGVEFHDSGAEQFFGNTPRFSYNGNGPYYDWSSETMQRVFDYVQVPSRFSGTKLPQTATGQWTFREPGKVNLNTLTETAWEALGSGRANFPLYETFSDYRQRMIQESAGPIRSPLAALFALDLVDNNADNPYSALENVMRLSDVTTTRSNVFAVWITVGYFEVEHFADYEALQEEHPELTHIDSEEMFDAVYPDGYVLGTEVGHRDGTHRRHRAFYLIDRSFPVDFRRGGALSSQAEGEIVFPGRLRE
ncbi:MAG: hypothetical protein FWG73_08345 [Planctomycetaceae bacterium]|nr:hypothetical protein [Planctomycetaceae bacterium]